MIYYNAPYSLDKKIADSYNSFMELVPSDNDYVCYFDGDTIFTTTNYGHMINEIVAKYPDVGCFTALTNRVGNQWQIPADVIKTNNDIEYHRNIGLSLAKRNSTTCIDVTDKGLFSGMCFVLKKELWKLIGKFKGNGMLGVDNQLHLDIRNAKQKLYLMAGVYVYHWYRGNNPKDTSHLK